MHQVCRHQLSKWYECSALTSFPSSPLICSLAANTIQLLDLSFCVYQSNILIWTKVSAILQITPSGTLCILAIIQFMRQSFQMYQVTKHWQLNRYMRLMTKQGILYFFACVCIPPSVFSAVLRVKPHRPDEYPS